MPSRSRSQASIDASQAKAPSRTSSRTTLASKTQVSKTARTSTLRNPTQPKQPSASDTSQSPPPSLKRARSTATLKEVNGVNGSLKFISKIKKAETVPDILPRLKKQRKAVSETVSGAPVILVNSAWVQVTSMSCPSLREIPGSRRRSLKVSLVPGQVQVLLGLPLEVYILFSSTRMAPYAPFLRVFNQVLTYLRRFGLVV